MQNQAHKTISEKTAHARMARICSAKECCSHDIRQKLQRLQLSDNAVERIISSLQKEKYIDDNRFTCSFIGDKIRFGKWGKIKIEFALRQKQISDEIVSEAFSEFSDDLLLQSLRPLLEKKLKSVKGNTEYDKRTKVIRFGLSRGFSMSEILQCLDKMPKEED